MSGRTKLCIHCGQRKPRHDFCARGISFSRCSTCRRQWGRQQHRIETADHAAIERAGHTARPAHDVTAHPMWTEHGCLHCSCGYLADLTRLRSSADDLVVLHRGHYADAAP